ncbi:MAG: hypothetical protein LBN92_07195, partial [Treponema sp.]|nr:hypothetical protein [Treponema sp.]
KISVLLACLTVPVLFLASCGGGKSALVGRWLLVEGSGFDDAEFLTDGTGIVDGIEVNWKVEKNRMYVTHPQRAVSFDYQLTGSKLALTDDDGDILVYLKPGGPSVLAGSWVLSAGEFPFERVELIKDGKGKADENSFKWAADNEKLFIIGFGNFGYKIAGSTLTLTYEGETGETVEFKKE